MEQKNIKLDLDGTEVVAELQLFDNSDKKKIKKLYKKWLSLSDLCQNMKGRRINIPEIISEGLFCVEFNCARFIKCSGKMSSSFDCLRLSDNKKIQIKACSVEHDLTSFGPKSKWDEIYLVHFFPNKTYDGSYVVYKIEDSDIYNHKVNKNETFKDQQIAGKRPRFSLMKDIIIPKGIKPTHIGNVLTDY